MDYPAELATQLVVDLDEGESAETAAIKGLFDDLVYALEDKLMQEERKRKYKLKTNEYIGHT